MLLSSVAETMFWSGRYIERAVSLARAIQAVERLSLDLPAKHALDLQPFLVLVGAPLPSPGPEPATPTALLQALSLNEEDSSSVLGALHAARENFRQARVVVPPELWSEINTLHQHLRNVRGEPTPRILEALGLLLEGGSRLEGLIESGMARDASHSFLQMGIQIERADMLLRVLAQLLPALAANGWERNFDDVRWSGLLDALGVRSMYRRRHHHQVDLATLLGFLLLDQTSPRSVAFCLRSVDDALKDLPRGAPARAAVARALGAVVTLSRLGPEQLGREIDTVLDALSELHRVVQDSYFPESAQAQPIPVRTTKAPEGPFEHLEREHAELELVLQLLEELAARAQRFEPLAQADLGHIVSFLTAFGELGHHEKEEMILTPQLVLHGFDWYEGPVAVMRREHRHEHRFIRVLTELASQPFDWSAEDRRRFATDAEELARFLRSHMSHEQSAVFSPASDLLPPAVQAQLARAFAEFDALKAAELEVSRRGLAALRLKYPRAS